MATEEIRQKVAMCLECHPLGITPCDIGREVGELTFDVKHALADLMKVGAAWMIPNPVKGQHFLWASHAPGTEAEP
jgi:hypothetical protein